MTDLGKKRGSYPRAKKTWSIVSLTFFFVLLGFSVYWLIQSLLPTGNPFDSIQWFLVVVVFLAYLILVLQDFVNTTDLQEAAVYTDGIALITPENTIEVHWTDVKHVIEDLAITSIDSVLRLHDGNQIRIRSADLGVRPMLALADDIQWHVANALEAGAMEMIDSGGTMNLGAVELSAENLIIRGSPYSWDKIQNVYRQGRGRRVVIQGPSRQRISFAKLANVHLFITLANHYRLNRR